MALAVGNDNGPSVANGNDATSAFGNSVTKGDMSRSSRWSRARSTSRASACRTSTPRFRRSSASVSRTSRSCRTRSTSSARTTPARPSATVRSRTPWTTCPSSRPSARTEPVRGGRSGRRPAAGPFPYSSLRPINEEWAQQRAGRTSEVSGASRSAVSGWVCFSFRAAAYRVARIRFFFDRYWGVFPPRRDHA